MDSRQLHSKKLKQQTSKRGLGWQLKISAALIGGAIAGQAIAADGQRFIVKYKDATQVRSSSSVKIERMMEKLATKSGMSLEHVRKMALDNRHVVHLKNKKDRATFLKMMKRLELDSNVLSIEEDAMMHPLLVPNDEFYDLQWHYFDAVGGMNAEAAWDTHDGTGVVVAVIDTGITAHTDLDANILPGYDFIADVATANDGDGRDADASDPGDAVAANECGFNFASNSSWHGTHVAGTIAAITDNTQGVAGVAYNAKVVPVRVLGKCGGFLSDIADGIVWASGGTVAGVPDNANPAQVINMSLGGSGACDATYQDAIDTAFNNGTTVVVAAGNSGADSVDFRPANCNNVINVAANDLAGNKASYSNFGSLIDVTAPGGETTIAAEGIASTLNDGTDVPGAETYVYYQGTSMAAPHVAGAAALLYQADPTITPAEVEAALIATARPMPGDCTEGCGAGIIDARAALDSIDGTPPLNVAPTAGFTVSVTDFDATFTDTSSDSDGTVASWSWDFGDGNSSTSQNPVNTYATDGTYTVVLTATDDDGATDDSSQDVVINSANVAPISSFTFVATDLQVAFTDGSSDSDGTVASWSWDFGDGNTSTAQNPVHDYANGGTFTVALTVTDDAGATNTSSQSVTLVAPNVAPTAGFTTSITDLSVDFTDTSSDSDGTVTSWSWDFGDGNTSTSQNPTNAYTTAGSYTVSLTATDDEGATSTDTQTVTVTEAGGETSGGFTETNVSPANRENLEFTIDVPAGATALDIDTSGGTGDVTLVVNFGSAPSRNDNDCIEQGAGNTHSCSFTDPAEGTWFIIVRGVAASSGVQLDAYWTAVDAGNIAPTSDFTVSTADLVATFTDTSSDSDGSVASYSWDFGDGNTSTAQNPTNTYATAGTYTVSLTVTDDEGATGTSSQSVTVTEAGTGTSGGFTETVSPASGEIISYTLDVPAGATSLEVDISGGTGNADLAINFGSTPTRNNNDCLETGAGNTHNCTITNPSEGTWFIIVRGASASTDVQLDAYWFDN